MHATLLDPATNTLLPQRRDEQELLGTTVSSLQRLKDTADREGGFFVFGDLSVARTGNHKLRFTLVEFQPLRQHCQVLGSVDSDIFTIVNTKDYKGQKESTYFTRSFGDQGVRLRIRKEPRGVKRKNDETQKSPEDAMRLSQSSSHDNSSPAQKRIKSDAEDRKDSIREPPNVPMAVYARPYAQTPSRENYQLTKPSSIPNNLPYNTGMTVSPGYANNAAGGPSYRSNILSSANTYANTSYHNSSNTSYQHDSNASYQHNSDAPYQTSSNAPFQNSPNTSYQTNSNTSFQNNPNPMMSGPATFNHGYAGVFGGYGARSTPSNSGELQGAFLTSSYNDSSYQ